MCQGGARLQAEENRVQKPCHNEDPSKKPPGANSNHHLLPPILVHTTLVLDWVPCGKTL